MYCFNTGSGHTLVAPDEHTKRQWIITIGKTLEKLDRTDLPSTPTPGTPVISKVSYCIKKNIVLFRRRRGEGLNPEEVKMFFDENNY